MYAVFISSDQYKVESAGCNVLVLLACWFRCFDRLSNFGIGADM